MTGNWRSFAFFRVDHPELKAIVDSFGDVVGDAELTRFSSKTLDLNLEGDLDYELCAEGSRVYNELDCDERYLQKVLEI